MKIRNIHIYGLPESMIKSGYPMRTDVSEMPKLEVSDSERARRLASAEAGSGHDCFLKGIIVQCDVEAPQYVWAQIQRYHWFDIVSSQSKMHKIKEADIGGMCNERVRQEAIDLAERMQALYREGRIDVDTLLCNLPMGYEYTAGISTNYLQLKTMFRQRHNHRLSFWNPVFVDFVKELPMSHLITMTLDNQSKI